MPVILLYRKMRKLQLEGVLYMSSWRASSCTENKVHISCVSNVWWCFSSSSSFWVCYYFRNISGSSYGEPFHLATWNAISLPICFPKTTESLMTQIWIKKIVHCLSLWGTLGNITKPLLAKLLCTTADSIKTGKQWLSYHTAKQQIEQFLMTRCIVSVCICVHAHGTCVGVRVYLHPRDKGL